MSRCGQFLWTVIVLALCQASIAVAAPPDFTGIWARFPDPYGDGPFPDNPPPPGGEPRLREPYAANYQTLQRRKQAADKEGKPLLDASTQCLPEGMPTLMGAVYNIQILQTRSEVLVLAEFLTQTRRIYLNEKMPPVDAITPSYNGYSVAHWEGDTLVVRTLGIRDDAKFFDMPQTRNRVITERLRLTAPDQLEDRVKIEDPTVFLVPYEFTYGYKKDPSYKIIEYICDHNRYAGRDDGSATLKVTPN